MSEEIIQEAKKIIESAKICIMGSVDGDKPCLRPMGGCPVSEKEFWFATHVGSRKVQQIRSNPNMELCYMDSDYNHIRLSGAAEVSVESEPKKKFWDLVPAGADYFKSPEDPDYAVIIFKADTLEYLKFGLGEKTQTVKL